MMVFMFMIFYVEGLWTLVWKNYGSVVSCCWSVQWVPVAATYGTMPLHARAGTNNS